MELSLVEFRFSGTLSEKKNWSEQESQEQGRLGKSGEAENFQCSKYVPFKRLYYIQAKYDEKGII